MYTPAYVVTVDGVDVGLVRDQSVFRQAVERVEERASDILGYDYHLAHEVSYEMALTGQDQGYFYEVVAVKAFRFFPGYLAGEEERGVQVLVGYVVLYLAHGWCINSLGVDWCGGAHG